VGVSFEDVVTVYLSHGDLGYSSGVWIYKVQI
jgi:hypothetical protein